MEFPLIYCNGDSYSDESFHDPLMRGGTYASIVGEILNGFVINNAKSGSCNRRIIRTSMSDLLNQKKINPNQKIIALLGLSFELRSEIWNDNIVRPYRPEESNFVTHVFSTQTDWRKNLMAGQDLRSINYQNFDKTFFQMYSKGRAFFFSPYAERINLLCDIIMFKKFLESINVDFLIFQSPKAEKLESEYLLNQFKNELKDDERIFDFESFGFVDWCYEQGFTPVDYLDRPQIGHYGPDAHRAFAEKILIPQILKFYQP